MNSLNLLKRCFNLFIILWFNIVFVEGIVGGYEPGFRSFKHTVSILENGYHICGGAILDDLHIVSAANCFLDIGVNYRNEIYSIVAGVTNTKLKNNDKIEIDVEKIYIPRAFRTFKNTDHNPRGGTEEGSADISVLKLEKPLGLNKNIQVSAVNFPNPNELISTNEDLIVSGFGYTNKHISIFITSGVNTWTRRSDIEPCKNCFEMAYTKANKITKTQCSQMHNYPIFDSQFCAQVNQYINNPGLHGLCKGDVGNPIIKKGNFLIGIYIRGSKNCNESEKAGIYTDFASHADFVSQAMKGQKSNNIRVAYYKTTKKIIGKNKKVLTED